MKQQPETTTRYAALFSVTHFGNGRYKPPVVGYVLSSTHTTRQGAKDAFLAKHKNNDAATFIRVVQFTTKEKPVQELMY